MIDLTECYPTKYFWAVIKMRLEGLMAEYCFVDEGFVVWL